MPRYYVNDRAQSNGDHEVHQSGCSFMPEQSNRAYLGEFTNCWEAVQAARKYPTPFGVVKIHPALSPLAAADSSLLWYLDQNGQGSGTCTSQHIAFLHQEVKRHEGADTIPIPANSHAGIYNAALANQTFSWALESMHGTPGPVLGQQARAVVLPLLNAVFAQGQVFDLTDPPAVLAAMGCTLDYSLTDGG
jgi:hypothetical protein